MSSEAIFAQALKLAVPIERARYLDEACGEDEVLRTEVESLLAAHNDAGSFLEKSPEELIGKTGTERTRPTGDDSPTAEPVEDAWRELLQSTDTPDRLGTLGPYEVIELVGRGGMGVVLRAFDPKLSRIVAIKLLAPELAVSATAVQRFLREARAAAAVIQRAFVKNLLGVEY